jgi:hypothetical protein
LLESHDRQYFYKISGTGNRIQTDRCRSPARWLKTPAVHLKKTFKFKKCHWWCDLFILTFAHFMCLYCNCTVIQFRKSKICILLFLCSWRNELKSCPRCNCCVKRIMYIKKAMYKDVESICTQSTKTCISSASINDATN